MGILKKSKKSKKMKATEIIEEKEIKNEQEATEAVAISNDVEDNKVEKPVRKTRKSSSKKKEVCRVIMAKPSFFVIKKNGETIVVNEKNDYRRGQDIMY